MCGVVNGHHCLLPSHVVTQSFRCGGAPRRRRGRGRGCTVPGAAPLCLDSACACVWQSVRVCLAARRVEEGAANRRRRACFWCRCYGVIILSIYPCISMYARRPAPCGAVHPYGKAYNRCGGGGPQGPPAGAWSAAGARSHHWTELNLTELNLTERSSARGHPAVPRADSEGAFSWPPRAPRRAGRSVRARRSACLRAFAPAQRLCFPCGAALSATTGSARRPGSPSDGGGPGSGGCLRPRPACVRCLPVL